MLKFCTEFEKCVKKVKKNEDWSNNSESKMTMRIFFFFNR